MKIALFALFINAEAMLRFVTRYNVLRNTLFKTLDLTSLLNINGCSVDLRDLEGIWMVHRFHS